LSFDETAYGASTDGGRRSCCYESKGTVLPERAETAAESDYVSVALQQNRRT
jgi:hypothetical protein